MFFPTTVMTDNDLALFDRLSYERVLAPCQHLYMEAVGDALSGRSADRASIKCPHYCIKRPLKHTPTFRVIIFDGFGRINIGEQLIAGLFEDTLNIFF